MTDELRSGFEYHYLRTRFRAQKYISRIPSHLFNYHGKSEIHILYPGCGVAPAAILLLEKIRETYSGKINLTLVDSIPQCSDFCIEKCRTANLRNCEIQFITEDLLHYAHRNTQQFDILFFEHPETEALVSSAIQFAFNRLPNLARLAFGTNRFSSYNYRVACALLTQKLNTNGIIIGCTYTLIEQYQLSALMNAASQFSYLQNEWNGLSLIPYPLREYNTWMIAQKQPSFRHDQISRDQLRRHIELSDFLLVLYTAFWNILLLYTTNYTHSYKELIRFSMIFAYGFYLESMMHNVTTNDLIRKSLSMIGELVLCVLPIYLNRSDENTAPLSPISHTP